MWKRPADARNCLLELPVGRTRLALLLAAGLQMLAEPHNLGVRILRDMAVLNFDGNVDRDRPTHGFDVIHKLKEFFVRVVTGTSWRLRSRPGRSKGVDFNFPE